VSNNIDTSKGALMMKSVVPKFKTISVFCLYRTFAKYCGINSTKDFSNNARDVCLRISIRANGSLVKKSKTTHEDNQWANERLNDWLSKIKRGEITLFRNNQDYAKGLALVKQHAEIYKELKACKQMLLPLAARKKGLFYFSKNSIF